MKTRTLAHTVKLVFLLENNLFFLSLVFLSLVFLSLVFLA